MIFVFNKWLNHNVTIIIPKINFNDKINATLTIILTEKLDFRPNNFYFQTPAKAGAEHKLT